MSERQIKGADRGVGGDNYDGLLSDNCQSKID